MIAPQNRRHARGDVAHLKLENPRFLFLEGWGVPSLGPLAPPTMARWWALPRPPRVPIPRPPPRPVATGAGDSTYRRCLAPVTFLPSDDEFVGASRGESPCCSCSRYSSLYCSRCSHRLSLFSFARAAHSCSCRYAARLTVRARGVGGSDHAAFTVTLCWQESSKQTQTQ
jgi:hypothetical protein